MNLDWQFFATAILKISKSIPLTLYLTVVSFLVGLILAIGIAIARNYKIRWLEPILKYYVSFNRGTPVMLQLYLVYYALPMLYDSLAGKMGWTFRSNQIPISALVIVALSINTSAYLSETIRAGLGAVSEGEIEAAYSLGMTKGLVIKRVIMPQALVICIPNFSTHIINLMLGTSLAFYVTLLEITGTANILAQDNWKYFESFMAAGVIYWGITIVIELCTHFIERKFNKQYGVTRLG